MGSGAVTGDAIMGKPDVVLSDDPTGNLDAKTGRQILDLLLAIHHESSDRILAVVTHDTDVARLLDRVVVLQDGQVILTICISSRLRS